MKWWFWVVGLIAVAAVAAPLYVGAFKPGPEAEASEFIRPGQTYVFTMGDVLVIGDVQEKPRGQWVKVRIINNKSHIPAQATWVNLQLVKVVSIVDAKDVAEEPRP